MSAVFFSMLHGVSIGCAVVFALLLIFLGEPSMGWAIAGAVAMALSRLLAVQARTTLLLRTFNSPVVEDRLVHDVVPGLSMASRVVMLANYKHPDDVQIFDVGCMAGLFQPAIAFVIVLPASATWMPAVSIPIGVLILGTGWYQFRIRLHNHRRRSIDAQPQRLDGDLQRLAQELRRPRWIARPRYLPNLPAARTEVLCDATVWEKTVLVAMENVDLIVLDVTNIYVSQGLNVELDWIMSLVDARRLKRRKLVLVCAHHDHARARAHIEARHPNLARRIIVFNDPARTRMAMRKQFFVMASAYRFLLREFRRDERAAESKARRQTRHE